MKLFGFALILMLSFQSLAGRYQQEAIFAKVRAKLESAPASRNQGGLNPENKLSILSLFPAESYLGPVFNSEDPELFRLTDAVTVDILNTPTGKKICELMNPVHRGNALAITFGLSAQAIRRLPNECLGKTNFLSKLGVGPQDDLTPMLPAFPYRYQFVFFKNGVDHFEGWTGSMDADDSMSFATYIGVPEKMTEERLVRTFVHELVQMFDRKNYRMLEADFEHVYRSRYFCAGVTALANPYARMALSSLRAMKMEDQILSEMKISPLPPRSPLPCTDQVRQLIPLMAPFLKLVARDQALHEFRFRSQCQLDFQSFTLDETLQILEKEIIHNQNGRAQNLCESFADAELAPLQDVSMQRGPRPRIGDGSGHRMAELRNLQFNAGQPYKDFVKDDNGRMKPLDPDVSRRQRPDYLKPSMSLKEEERPAERQEDSLRLDHEDRTDQRQ